VRALLEVAAVIPGECEEAFLDSGAVTYPDLECGHVAAGPDPLLEELGLQELPGPNFWCWICRDWVPSARARK
jgi:hypothetical protein